MTLALVAVVLLAGCGGNGAAESAPAPVPTRDEALAAAVPRDVARDGRLLVATDPVQPPLEFLGTDGQVQGADIDLIVAVAAVLGLKPEFESVPRSDIAVGVRTGRFEVGMSGLRVRPDRRTLTDAVLYLRTGSQLVRSAAHPQLTRETVCGDRVAAIAGSAQSGELAALSRRCRRSGEPQVEIVARPDPDELIDALRTGDAAGMLADSTVTQDAVARFPAELQPAGGVYDRVPSGMLTSAEFGRLTVALKRALQRLIDSGYYLEVLQRWNLADAAVPRARVSAADVGGGAPQPRRNSG